MRTLRPDPRSPARRPGGPPRRRPLRASILVGPLLLFACGGGGGGPTGPGGGDRVFAPTSSTSISGTAAYDRVEIPAGVTVQATGDLDLVVAGPVEIAGTLTGDCVAVTIDAADAVTVTGALSNACGELPSGDPPPLSVFATGEVVFDGAVVRSSGDVKIDNSGDRQAGLEPAQASPYPVRIVRGTSIAHDPARAAQGHRGADHAILASGDLVIDAGVEIVAQNGGNGASSDVGGTLLVEAFGIDGSRGGEVFLTSQDDAVFFTRESGGLNRIRSGDGGDGGDARAAATASPDFAGDAFARAGGGGKAGAIEVQAREAIEIVEGAAEFEIGSAGDGGEAIAVAPDGPDATAERDAREGGHAGAVGGDGGEAGYLVDALVLEGSTDDVPVVKGGDGGSGGLAQATAGTGGDGLCGEHPDGAPGGVALAYGGEGGDGLIDGGPDTDVPIGAGGSGGLAKMRGGEGGAGASCCLATPLGGGNGGHGGYEAREEILDLIRGRLPSLDDRGIGGGAGGTGTAPKAADGETIFDQFGNGGDGGNGTLPGLAGEAGFFLELEVAAAHPRTVQPSFQPGAAGRSCPPSKAALIEASPFRATVAFQSVTGNCGFEGTWDGIEIVDGGDGLVTLRHDLFGRTLEFTYGYDEGTGEGTPPDGSSVKDAVTFDNGVTLEVELGTCQAEVGGGGTSDARSPLFGPRSGPVPAQASCSGSGGTYALRSDTPDGAYTAFVCRLIVATEN